jgi:hypothetical protein
MKQLNDWLKPLKHIRPSHGSLMRSREIIMASIQPKPRKFPAHILFGMRIPAAMGALSMLLILMTQVPKTNKIESPILSLDAHAIQAEQQAVNATGSMITSNYLKRSAPVISLALTDIADPAKNWGSESKIKQAIALLSKREK